MTYFKIKITLSLAFLCLFQTAFAQTKISAEIAQKIDAQFEQLTQSDAPAGAIVVVEKGAIIYQKAFGNANIENQVAANTETKFLAADLCNQFVAYGILLLTKEGKLSLDDDIRKHLPDFPDYDKTVTVRHLLMHQHSLLNYMDLQLISGRNSSAQQSQQTVINLIKNQPKLNAAPGTEYNYNSTGFIVAAEIIERITKQSFAEFAQKHIFEPLKMSNSFFEENALQVWKNKATTYYPAGDGYEYDPMNYHTLPATNLYVSIEDLGKWMVHLQGNGMVIQQFNTEAVPSGEEGEWLGLGQFLDEWNGLKRIQHNGLAYGNLTYMGRFPAHDFGVAVLSNNSQFSAYGTALATAELLLNEHLVIEEVAEVTETLPAVYKTVSQAQMQAVCGNYWNEEHFYNRQIELKNDTLFYIISPGREFPLGALADNEFGILGRDDARFVFEEKDGQKMMTFYFGEYEYEYEACAPVHHSEETLKQFTGTFYAKNIETAYQVSVENNQLVFSNLRVAGIPFKPIKNDIFISSTWWFSHVEFVKNKAGEVTGFLLSTGDVKGLLFEKI